MSNLLRLQITLSNKILVLTLKANMFRLEQKFWPGFALHALFCANPKYLYIFTFHRYALTYENSHATSVYLCLPSTPKAS